jgi:hypothetical protein
VQRENADSSMLVTLFGMVYAVRVFPIGYWISVVRALLNNTPSMLA